jgi:uncharacterized protein (TIGR03084 family)
LSEERAKLLASIVDDLRAEARALDALLTTLDPGGWLTPTPAAGWDIRDSVAHLAVGDELALECVVEDRVPVVMQQGIEAVVAGEAAAHAFERTLVDRGRALEPSAVHHWWRKGNADLCTAVARVDPSHRLPWGPNQLSPASFVSARVMETWAHGLDCFDAVGAEPPYTDRLRHVADLSLRALPYAFMIHGADGPGPVRLDLTSPSGDAWCIGPEDATTVIAGAAADWCRVAVRRDRGDERTRLRGEGPDLEAVLSHVQAYL